MSKIKSQRCFFLTVDGDIKASNPKRWTLRNNASLGYYELVAACARIACQEQDWEISKEPLYMYINAYVRPTRSVAKDEKRVVKSYWFANVRPELSALLLCVMKVLEGIVYKNKEQICATSIRKVTTKTQPRLEIFIGVPSTWEEIDNDLSYAEKASEELEKQ